MRLLMLDDHALFRAGMRHLLAQWRPGIDIAEAEALSSALDVLRDGPKPDIALVDLALEAGEPDISVVSSICRAMPNVPVVVVSMADERSLVRRALENGARGFISKTDSGEQMLKALEIVLAGGTSVPASAWELEEDDPEGDELLSPRQKEVLRLIVAGLSNREIADQLAIAEPTVKVHVHKILKLLGVKSRAKAMVAARERGLM
jgi:DNA-binding NarL/FixJ family response regulator